jgi:coenzyme F420-0:L-glutamate ligase/coenzyme F420-1:gamma-L-glutamate ligase
VASISLTALPGIPRIKPGDDLAAIALDGVRAAGLELADGDVLVLAQKIVSKAEDRFVALDTIVPGERAQKLAPQIDKDPRLVQLILDESTEVLRTRIGVIVVVHRLGYVLANAGIDASNVESPDGRERVLLLPRDPDASCAALRATIRQRSGKDIAVVINDSLGRAWRNGTVGVALGAAGLPGLLDQRGQTDLNGRVLRVTEIGVGDEVAAAASLLMGQAAEGRPIVLLRGFPHARREGNAAELIRPKHMDMFR